MRRDCGGEQRGIIDRLVNGVELKIERKEEVTCGCEEEEEDESFLRNCIHQPINAKGRGESGGESLTSKYFTVKGKMVDENV